MWEGGRRFRWLKGKRHRDELWEEKEVEGLDWIRLEKGEGYRFGWGKGSKKLF